MSEIIVRKDGDKWGAWFGDHQIIKSACKACVINVLLTVTKQSDKYKTIVIQNEEGIAEKVITTGVLNGRTAS